MQRARVRIGINADRTDGEPFGGTRDPAGNLAAVGDEH
jgi:hypothetical protein